MQNINKVKKNKSTVNRVNRGRIIKKPEPHINQSNQPSKSIYSMNKSEVLRILGSNQVRGLSESEVHERLKIYGENKLREAKKKNLFIKFLEQFADFMIIILLIAAAISFITAIIQGDKTEFLDPVIILCIIIINAIVGLVQEFKAEKSIAELKKLTASETLVLRNGVKQKIPAEVLVPGDIILLEAGDSVPADARILDNLSAASDESALTGESAPVLKDDTMLFAPETPLGDRKNMLYMTGVITSGKCSAIVTGTGMNTEVGKIAEILTQEEESVTPLQERLAKTGKILGITALIVCSVIFILGIIQKMPALEIFMLSISLAVAAMPASVK